EFSQIKERLQLPGKQQEEKISIEGLNNMEQKVFAFIQETPIHIDKIALATELDTATLSGILLQLEMMEKITNTGGHFYLRAF
ncbi:MAG: hypothetical protein HQK84_09945, partial [Nitrospinae bacterium]|nr:hypothetical protein [Nitrospinota bacterium]